MKFNGPRVNRIAVCIVDITDICESAWAKSIAVNLSDQLVQYFYNRSHDIYIDKNENVLLTEVAKDDFYTHAVVIASGNAPSFVNGKNLSSAIIDFCSENSFSIAGHILDRKESYYELQHQFYIVNLQDYRELGFPEIGYAEDSKHVQVEPIRSTDSVHSDYVPQWISTGTKVKEYSKKLHGWNLIAEALKGKKVIIDIGRTIRNLKEYFYYEYDSVFLRHVTKLQSYSFFASVFVNPLNTDTINSSISLGAPVEQFVTVANGFNWIYYLESIGYTSSTNVIFTDINHNALMFTKAMITEWDGNDYASFYMKFIESIMNTLLHNTYYDDGIRSQIPYINDQWNEFKNKFDNWDEVWNRIKSLKYDFILMDYMAAEHFNWLDANKNTFINLSDIFTFTHDQFNRSVKCKVACENRLINSLRGKNPNITVMFSSRSFNGFYKEVPNILKVSDINPIIINDLKKPSWHADDWDETIILT